MVITLEEASRSRKGQPTLFVVLCGETKDMGLSIRPTNALILAGLEYVWQAMERIEAVHYPNLVKNFGRKCHNEFKEVLVEHGIEIGSKLADNLVAALKAATSEKDGVSQSAQTPTALPPVPSPPPESDFAAMLEALRLRLEARRADLKSERNQLVVIESVVRSGTVHVIALPSTPDTIAEAIAKHRETGSLDAFTERVAAIDRLLVTIDRAFDRPYPFSILRDALKALVTP